MKKVFLCSLIGLILVSLFAFCNAETVLKRKVSSKQKIEFTTRDGFILVGDLYLAQHKSNKPLVICAHSFSMNASSWQKLAENLRLKDYNVLAMDLRGHGRSVYNEKLKIKSRYQFTREDWAKLPKDYVQSIQYIKSNYADVNTNDTILIGADLGAIAGMIGSLNLGKPPIKTVLISPVMSFKGLNMPVKSLKFYNTKMMNITTKTDRVYVNFYLATPAITKQYPLGGPGTQLIKVNPIAIGDIVNFVVN